MGSSTRSQTSQAIKAAYMEWLKIPRKERLAEKNNPNPRWPSNRVEFCEKYNVSRTTLFRWDNDPEFIRELSNEALGLVTPDEFVQMIEVQKAKALNGDRQSFKLLMDYFNIAGENSPKVLEPDEGGSFKQMSDAEIEALLAEEEDDDY